MNVDESQPPRPWAINRTCLRISLALAVVALAEALFSAIYAWATGQHSGALWALAAAWPAFYGLLYVIAYGIAGVDQRGPVTKQLGWLGDMYGPFRPVMDRMYRLAPNAVLLVFPAVFTLMATALAWCTWTHQLN